MSEPLYPRHARAYSLPRYEGDEPFKEIRAARVFVDPHQQKPFDIFTRLLDRDADVSRAKVADSRIPLTSPCACIFCRIEADAR